MNAERRGRPAGLTPARDAAGEAVEGPAGFAGLGRITELRTRPIDVQLVRPWGADVTQLHVIEVLVDTEAGVTGHGFSWTPSIGAYAVRGMLDHDIREFAIGRSADAVTLWPSLWSHLHEAGSGGVTTIAMAGLDLALWDAAGRATDRSVTELLGARRSSVEVYGSGVNRHYSLEELVAQAKRWRDAGHRLVKMKVGLPELAADVERVAAVRETIGPDVRLAIDANQLWDLPLARAALAELERFGLAWLEEPLRADDLAAHALLRTETDVPIALGENLHTVYRFAEAIDLGACDIVQPNIVRVGGITPFLEVARLASERGVPLYPHLLPELSAQLELAVAEATAVEDVEDASFERLGVLAGPSPVVFDGREASSRGLPGLGLAFA